MKRKAVCLIDEKDDTMAEAWLRRLLAAEVECWREGTSRRVRVQFPSGEELAEEWNLSTNCLIRRAWKRPALGPMPTTDWTVELGEPPPAPPLAPNEMREANDQPVITRRNTRNSLEWRIRNLPYPLEVFSVAADANAKALIVRTTNKKYYKKLSIPEIERIGIMPSQANIQFTHKFNTLIITYKKPSELIEFDKKWCEELTKIEQPDIPVNDCKAS